MSRSSSSRAAVAATIGLVMAGIVTASANLTPDAASRTKRPRAVPDIPREGRLDWGLYQILWHGDRFAALLDQEIERLGRPQYVTFFRDMGRPYPVGPCRRVIERGATPIISLELQHWGRGRTDDRDVLPRIAAGAYDDFLRDYAREARRCGHDVWLRFGFEMNGDWFSWGGRPELFIAAWRRAHDIFAREGAGNVVWVWAPNAVSGPDSPENGLEKYWPGDEFVDVIGLDGYNFGDTYSRWHEWESAEAIFRPALDKIRESGVSQPVFITEFGCTDDVAPERRARWIRDAYSFFASRTEVTGALWFNHDKRREGERNWRIDADTASVAAWRETFARGSFPAAGR